VRLHNAENYKASLDWIKLEALNHVRVSWFHQTSTFYKLNRSNVKKKNRILYIVYDSRFYDITYNLQKVFNWEVFIFPIDVLFLTESCYSHHCHIKICIYTVPTVSITLDNRSDKLSYSEYR
jgi:hypothetical protein